MVRRFAQRPVPREVIDRIVDTGRRAPSAGFSQGLELLVLDAPEAIATFWETTRDPEFGWEDETVAHGPTVLILPLPDARRYLERYAEPDKIDFGMDEEANWPVRFWEIDAAMASMLILLAAVDEGLGGWFFGITHGERELLDGFGVPGTCARSASSGSATGRRMRSRPARGRSAGGATSTSRSTATAGDRSPLALVLPELARELRLRDVLPEVLQRVEERPRGRDGLVVGDGPFGAGIEGFRRIEPLPALPHHPVEELQQLGVATRLGDELRRSVPIREGHPSRDREPPAGAVHRMDGQDRDRVGILGRRSPCERLRGEPLDRVAHPAERFVEELSGGLDQGIGHQGDRRLT